MTRYTVVWHDDALNRLAEIWLRSPQRQSVSSATLAADRHLATDPQAKGIAVEGNLRQIAIPPLRLLFSVNQLDRMVKILDVVLG